MTSSSSFFHTITVGTFAAYELDGTTPVTDFIVTTESGHVYATPDLPSSVPEPSVVILLASGLLGLMVFRRRFSA